MASAGMLRIIWTVESSAASTRLESPVASPSANPTPPPIANPANAREALTLTSAHISPLRTSFHAASAMASGSGRIRAESQPRRALSSHEKKTSAGTIHGTTRLAND